jgi:predicted dehydrogenase
MMQERFGNGGPFVDIGVHAFDLWRGLFQSEATRVTARAHTFARYQPEAASVREFAPDTGSTIVEFASGDLGVLNVSWGMPRGVDLADEAGWVVIGPDGYLKVDDRWRARLARRGESIAEIAPLATRPIDDDVVDFAARLREGRPPFADGVDGQRALRIALAALESIETGKTVELNP